MNAEAKTLADELRTIARCIYIAVEKTVADDIAGKATKAADFLDRLSAPVEGVGLTRYDPDVTPQGNILWEEVAGGDWVKVDDATAALAAKEAVRRKSDEIGAMKAEQYVAERKAHEETKAERDALKAALGRRTDERIVNLNAEALAEIKAVVDGDSDQDVGHIIYGLLDELAALSTVTAARMMRSMDSLSVGLVVGGKERAGRTRLRPVRRPAGSGRA